MTNFVLTHILKIIYKSSTLNIIRQYNDVVLHAKGNPNLHVEINIPGLTVYKNNCKKGELSWNSNPFPVMITTQNMMTWS